MKITTVIGARPQFIKAAPLSKAFREGGIEEDLLHTGQHYDAEMSEIFFRELGIPAPRYHLSLGGGTHGQMTGRMLEAIERVLLEDVPEWVLVYGDTNSTLAGALAAAKLQIPICHVEAGLRSFNRSMPEEINRVLADHLAAKLYCSSEQGLRNLADEGVTRGVEVVGDVMADASRLAREIIDGRREEFLHNLDGALPEGEYALLTMHRPENTDVPVRLRALVAQLNALDQDLIFPVHPRTARALAGLDLELGPRVRKIPPVGYLEMAALLAGASLVLTDSGGLQKEAYWARVPCVTLRTETEWIETVHKGWNAVLGDEAERLRQCVEEVSQPGSWKPLYGDGDAAHRIVSSFQRES